jgi:hypothetical protein
MALADFLQKENCGEHDIDCIIELLKQEIETVANKVADLKDVFGELVKIEVDKAGGL